jgi:hypothetical protein
MVDPQLESNVGVFCCQLLCLCRPNHNGAHWKFGCYAKGTAPCLYEHAKEEKVICMKNIREIKQVFDLLLNKLNCAF